MQDEITITGSRAKWTMPPTQGELQGTYTGTFEFKCFLTPTEQLQAGREHRALLGNLAHMASEIEYKLAYALTQLKLRIVSAPPFWSSTGQDGGIAGNIGDTNVIGLVLNAAELAETMYKTKMTEERDVLLDSSIRLTEDKIKEDAGDV
jgi:hypothetical protein